MTAVELSDLLSRYRDARNSLEQHKTKTFPSGTPVVVSSPRYRGSGISVLSDGCPADQLPVRLGNGNVWLYPLEDCRVAPMRKENASGMIDEEETEMTTSPANDFGGAPHTKPGHRETDAATGNGAVNSKERAPTKWIPVAQELPPDGEIVLTKIDNAQGCRNEQRLKLRGRLWFVGDGKCYVYYTPTHWARD